MDTPIHHANYYRTKTCNVQFIIISLCIHNVQAFHFFISKVNLPRLSNKVFLGYLLMLFSVQSTRLPVINP